MVVCVGMSTTLHGYLRGQVTDSHLQEAHFYFSCDRSHLFGHGLPFEVTTLNTLRPVRHAGRYTLLSVDPEFRQPILRFIELMKEADDDSRVTWAVRNQKWIVGTLPMGTRYFWRRGWDEQRTGPTGPNDEDADRG